MGFNRGISANIKLPAGSRSNGVEQLSQIMSKIKGGTQIGRVTDITNNKIKLIISNFLNPKFNFL